MNDLIINTDLEIENGDWKVADSDNQNIYAILKARKGQFYQHPLLGFGMDDYDHASIDERIVRRDIISELKKDNYKVDKLEIKQVNENFEINILGTKLK